MAKITELCIYPIKSCAGISVPAAHLAPGGLKYDRRYMLIDEAGRFVSARTLPLLLQVRVELLEHSQQLRVSAAGKEPLLIPLQGPEQQQHEVSLLEVSIWKDQTQGLLCDSGSQWFSDLSKKKLRLVYQPENGLRQINPERAQLGQLVSFADAYPLLLCSQTSLDDLNERLRLAGSEAVPMSRFRPNVVVAGLSAFDEDEWAEITLGQHNCVTPKLCDRCVVPSIDPKVGRASREPSKTLASYRRWNGAVWFGSNVIAPSSGLLRVGDEVLVQKRQVHPRQGTPQ